jgi:aldose 1-epimerase
MSDLTSKFRIHATCYISHRKIRQIIPLNRILGYNLTIQVNKPTLFRRMLSPMRLHAILLCFCFFVPLSIQAEVKESPFGEVDGQKVTLYTLDAGDGFSIKTTNYGTIITHLFTKDKDGKVGDIVLGFDELEGYLKGHPYFGANVGRVANRVAKGKFTLDGKTYQLATNNGAHSLHGGVKGFDKQVWKVESTTSNPPSIKFSRVSKDGEEGYPGNLSVEVTYTLKKDPVPSLEILYHATTDAATPVNLAHHSYFNLDGQESGTILNHKLRLAAPMMTESDETMIPTGKIIGVKGTPFDFTSYHVIGERIKEIKAEPQGYDLNYVTSAALQRKLRQPGETSKIAEVIGAKSGRKLTLLSSEPGVQFYTGNFLDGSLKGKGGAIYKMHQAFCLEAQHYPDSPNQPTFPSIILKPGEKYMQKTIYQFSVEK